MSSEGRKRGYRSKKSKSGGSPSLPYVVKDAMGFDSVDPFDYRPLQNEESYFLQQDFSDDTKAAIETYLDKDSVSGSLYSPSQILNYKLRNGDTLSASEQKMYDDLQSGMHNLGQNITLERYDRIGFMEMLGINNYDTKSIDTLKSQLVGTEYVDRAFGSTSYNNFSKAPNGGKPFTDKCVKLNIQAPASTQAFMPGNGKGGNLGEIILAPNTRYRIKDLRYTGKMGRSGLHYYKQIEIDVEIF